MARKALPAGSWAIQANVHIYYGLIDPQGANQSDCQLRVNGTDTIGAALDSRVFASQGHAMLPMNGGVFVAPGGAAFADVWCRAASGSPTVDTQLMAIQVGGFF